MEFIGEHLLPGKIGHFLILLSFVFSIISAYSFFKASADKKPDGDNWLRLARISYFIQIAGILSVFAIVYYLCANHYYEYMYVYKHASRELEAKYLLACIWEGQEGSFLLWSICQAVLGGIIIFISRKNSEYKLWEPGVLGVLSVFQIFLLLMILGIYIGDLRIGNSLFSLTRNEIVAPIFTQPNYLDYLKDGMGLNVLLRNYWMVIHPPVLFLGFAGTLVPFAFALASLINKQYTSWVKPAMPWTLMAAAVLGVGIMMGGKWAYESLSFGGYWAWDPVENASLVPWLILIAGIHTLLIFRATGHSLKASYLFILLAEAFVIYSTFLTRTGILGEASVHSFTDAGKTINVLLTILVTGVFLVPMGLLAYRYKHIPAKQVEENTSSREFWMFIGSLIFFLTAIFIIAKTSTPVINKLFGTSIAPPEDVEFSYNKVIILIAILVGLLTAVAQYLKYKATSTNYLVRKMVPPTVIASAITVLMAVFLPFTFTKHGPGFLIAIYVASFSAIYAVVANAYYLFSILKARLLNAGGSVAHFGFGLIILGMLISSSNKQVISNSMVNGITFPAGTDPMSKEQDNPLENLTLIRKVPTTMGNYDVTFDSDSMGHEKGRKFYKLNFENKASDKVEFVLKPDVYMMKDNNMSSNPDIKTYLTRDIFTYIAYALTGEGNEDTARFSENLMHAGDTAFYSKGYVILDAVEANPADLQALPSKPDMSLRAKTRVVSKDGLETASSPALLVKGETITPIDDTLYAQNIFLRFVGVKDKDIRLGIKESSRIIDFVTVKTYVFPYINLVWLGIVITALGLIISMIHRANLSATTLLIVLATAGAALFYLFLIAAN